MDPELRKILLRRKNKVIVNSDTGIAKELFNSFKGIFQENNTKFDIPDLDYVEPHLEEFSIEFRVFLKNYKTYSLFYNYGKRVKTNFIESDKEKIPKEKAIKIREEMDSVYKKEYEKMKNKLMLAASLNRNIENLGYSMDEGLFDKIAILNEEEMDKLGKEIVNNLKEMVGGNVVYTPMYPNFPKQVMELKDGDLYLNAIFHYWSFGQYYPPCYKEEERETALMEVKLKYIGLGSESDVHTIMKNLMNAAEAIASKDIEDLEVYFEKYPGFMETIPDSIVNKENLAVITKLILKICKDPSTVDIAKRFSTTTDVLRLAAALSDQSPALEGKFKFKSFSNKERRLIMALLNKCNNRLEDLYRHRNKWERVCERIHPDKFKNTYPKLVDDLLGVYKYNRVTKFMKKEILLYKDIFKFIDEQTKEENKNNFRPELVQSYLDRLVALKAKVVIDVEDSLKNTLVAYINAHKDYDSENKEVLSVDKSMIEKRIDVINKICDEYDEKAKQFKSENKRFATIVEEAVKNKEYVKAMELLSQRPGVFARRLDEFLLKYENTDEILKFFEDIAPKASVKVLLSVKGYFQKRNKDISPRIFLIKGKNPKFYAKRKGKLALEQELCNKVCRICESALIQLFEEKPKMNNVYIDKDIKKILVPQDVRSANAALENYSKGSRFSITYKKTTPEQIIEMTEDKQNQVQKLEEKKKDVMEEKELFEKSMEISTASQESLDDEEKEANEKANKEKLEKLNKEVKKIENDVKKLQSEIEDLSKSPICTEYKKIRCFIWWTNMKDHSLDIDLSIMVLNSNYEKLTHVSFTNLRNEQFQIYHSGDITNGGPVDGKGVAEFIDLDPKIILEQGGRYILFNVISYVGIPFEKMENCKFGWMEREALGMTNELFEPKAVRQKLDMSSSNTSTMPVIFDCETREFIWMDTTVSDSNTFSTIEGGEKKMNVILKYYCEPLKENIYNLLDMHVKARSGTLVDSIDDLKDGDTAFVMEYPYKKVEGVTYIRPTDLDVIMSEFMTSGSE